MRVSVCARVQGCVHTYTCEVAALGNLVESQAHLFLKERFLSNKIVTKNFWKLVMPFPEPPIP